jgi:hypothetical protein
MLSWARGELGTHFYMSRCEYLADFTNALSLDLWHPPGTLLSSCSAL